MGLKVTWVCDDCHAMIEAREMNASVLIDRYNVAGHIIATLPTGWRHWQGSAGALALCPVCAEKRLMRGDEHGPA